MEYYSVTKRRELLIHAVVWMKSQNNYAERSKKKKRTYYTIP